MVTNEEFHIMLDELLYQESASFEMLCSIADRVLRPSVRRWCGEDEALKGKAYEEDIMQEVFMRLIKTTVSHFLLRQGSGGPVNDDPAGFEDWMFTVARNIKKDFSNQVRKIAMRNTELGDENGPADEGQWGSDLDWERKDKLSRAFSVVLDSDAQVYKVLTWAAQCLFVIDLDITKIQSNELIVRTFEEQTLFQMRDVLFETADRIEWIRITGEQKRKIDCSLRQPYDARRQYGQVKYREFFMKKGGKATISDWVNRMNNMIKRVMANEAHNC